MSEQTRAPEEPQILAAAPPRLETARLIVEPYRDADAEALAALAGDLAVARMMASIPHPFGLSEAAARIEASAFRGAPGFRLAVRRRSDAALVGEVGLGAETPPMLAYWLGQDHWGQGYASEMLPPFLDWAAARLGLSEVAADCYLDNPGSLRVLERLGFEALAETVKTCSMARDQAAPTRLFVKRFGADR